MSLKVKVMSDSLLPHGLYSPWNSPGQNAGVGSRSLLQGIFPTQELNPGLLHCRQIPVIGYIINMCMKTKDLIGDVREYICRPCVTVSCCPLVSKSCLTLCNCQAPLSMGFLRQEYRNGLPFPSPDILCSLSQICQLVQGKVKLKLRRVCLQTTSGIL